ncbi:MAG: hypothetical protein NTV19_20005 [Burkholderiales bacterium]|nr:hypothetical protein [Burkholderiales bacterium]
MWQMVPSTGVLRLAPSVDRPGGARWLVGLLLLSCGLTAFAQPPAGRLEPQERARLRHELRQQASGGPMAEPPPHRHRGAAGGAFGGWGGYGPPAGQAGHAGAESRPLALPVMQAPAGAAASADASAPAPVPIPAREGVAFDRRGENGAPRLSPEERRQLRLQLHEDRQRWRSPLPVDSR